LLPHGTQNIPRGENSGGNAEGCRASDKLSSFFVGRTDLAGALPAEGAAFGESAGGGVPGTSPPGAPLRALRLERGDGLRTCEGSAKGAVTDGIIDWPAACHDFNGNYSKIFLSRKHQGTATRIMMAQDCKRLLPQDGDRWSGQPAHFRKQVAATNHDQPAAERIESLDGKLWPFVGDEFACQKVIILDFRRWNALEPISGHRRMDNSRIAPVIFSDACGDCLRIGDVAVNPH
jgi:hypothetical protein